MAMDLDEAIIRLEAANTGSELIEALDEITAEAEAYAYISQGIRRTKRLAAMQGFFIYNIAAL